MIKKIYFKQIWNVILLISGENKHHASREKTAFCQEWFVKALEQEAMN